MTLNNNTWIDERGQLISSPRITRLNDGEIFVFGSNSEGHHGGGAARFAYSQFGAVWGEGNGLHGRSYAIDTMSGRRVMFDKISEFLEFASVHPELIFLVTEIGCGIAGYSPREVAPAFRQTYGNVALPGSFVEVLWL